MKKQETEQEKIDRLLAWYVGMLKIGLRRSFRAMLDEERSRADGCTRIYQKIEIEDAQDSLSLIVDSPCCVDEDGAAFVATTRLVGLAAEKRDYRLSTLVQLLTALSPIPATEVG